jgi:hypothetical protein
MILSWSNLIPDEKLPSQGRKRAKNPWIIHFETIWHNIKVVTDIVLLLMNGNGLTSHRESSGLQLPMQCPLWLGPRTNICADVHSTVWEHPFWGLPAKSCTHLYLVTPGRELGLPERQCWGACRFETGCLHGSLYSHGIAESSSMPEGIVSIYRW